MLNDKDTRVSVKIRKGGKWRLGPKGYLTHQVHEEGLVSISFWGFAEGEGFELLWEIAKDGDLGVALPWRVLIKKVGDVRGNFKLFSLEMSGRLHDKPTFQAEIIAESVTIRTQGDALDEKKVSRLKQDKWTSQMRAKKNKRRIRRMKR